MKMSVKMTVTELTDAPEPTNGNRSAKRRPSFLISVLVGAMIVSIFEFIGMTPLGERYANMGYDALIKVEKIWYSNKSNPLSESPVYFIDITHNDYTRWNKDRPTPLTRRDKLANIVQAAVDKHAAVIVLDILFEEHDADDQQLIAMMQRNKSKTHIILPVRIGHNGDIKNNIFANEASSAKGAIFQRGLSMAEASGSDGLVRYWISKKYIIEGDNKKNIIWSIPVLALSLQDCDSLPLTPENSPAEGDSYIHTQRIRYKLIPGTSSTLHINSTAGDIEANKSNFLPDLKGKIVIIGNSSPDMGDIHRTPVGSLPGMYIIGNAINTLSRGLQPKESGRWLTIHIELFVILLAAYMFHLLSPFLAQSVSAIILFMLLFPLSCLLFIMYGTYYNFALPILGMGLHRQFENIWDLVVNREWNSHKNH